MELAGTSLFSPDEEARDDEESNPHEYFEHKPMATPATRRLAKELRVDLRRIAPSGADGRVTAEDVRAAASAQNAAEPAPPLREDRAPIRGLMSGEEAKAFLAAAADSSAEEDTPEDRKLQAAGGAAVAEVAAEPDGTIARVRGVIAALRASFRTG